MTTSVLGAAVFSILLYAVPMANGQCCKKSMALLVGGPAVQGPQGDESDDNDNDSDGSGAATTGDTQIEVIEDSQVFDADDFPETLKT